VPPSAKVDADGVDGVDGVVGVVGAMVDGPALLG
jgi:hypothetical protein